MSTSNLFIVAAKRTPFGAFGGKLKGLTANELGGIVAKAVLTDVLPSHTPIDSVIFGNVAQTSNDAAYLARHISHRAGLPITTPALTINRLCGSGFQSIINAAHEILCGDASIVLTGGSESMSQSPYALRDIRWGTRYGIDLKGEDTLAAALVDRYPTVTPMGITAENLAKQYKISRVQCDEFALRSQQQWNYAHQNGFFQSELVPVTIPGKKRGTTETFSVDEHVKPQTTLSDLSKLPSVFIKSDGTVTAGNASGICDGAAAVVVANESAVHKYELKPLARIVAWHVVGVEPTIMGIGPVPAIQGVLKKAKLSLSQIDLIEINEAFAAQCLAVINELGLQVEQVNLHGGAIAMGHPLAASGSRIAGHLAHSLSRGDSKYALGSACIGGGQGIALILERV